jgi:hypothetical protein
MPVTVRWGDSSHTFILYDFVDPWDWAEMWEALRADDEMLDSVDHVVHLIFDFRATKQLPTNPAAQLKGFASAIHAHVGYIVFVGADLWTQMMGEMFYRLYGRQTEGMAGVKAVHTLEEAIAIVKPD